MGGLKSRNTEEENKKFMSEPTPFKKSPKPMSSPNESRKQLFLSPTDFQLSSIPGNHKRFTWVHGHWRELYPLPPLTRATPPPTRATPPPTTTPPPPTVRITTRRRPHRPCKIFREPFVLIIAGYTKDQTDSWACEVPHDPSQKKRKYQIVDLTTD